MNDITPEAVFEAALAAPKGHRVPVTFPDRQTAIGFRFRCNAWRAAIRKRNRQIYPLGHPMHGASCYDSIMLSLHPTDPTLYAINPTATILNPEPIPEE